MLTRYYPRIYAWQITLHVQFHSFPNWSSTGNTVLQKMNTFAVVIVTVITVFSNQQINATKYKIQIYNTSIFQDKHVLNYKDAVADGRSSYKLQLFKDLDRVSIRIELNIISISNTAYYRNLMNSTFEFCDVFYGDKLQNTVFRFFVNLQLKNSDLVNLPMSCPIKAVRMYTWLVYRKKGFNHVFLFLYKNTYYSSGPSSYTEDLPRLFPNFGFHMVTEFAIFKPHRKIVLQNTQHGECVEIINKPKRRRNQKHI